MKIFAVVTALLWSTLLGNPLLAAEDVTVRMNGSGGSRNEALLHAKRNAIEQGIGTFLIAETEVRNFQLKKDLILTRTEGAVKNYRIIQEEKQGEEFLITIEATVSLDGIREDLMALQILLESMAKPRMMVVIAEEGSAVAESIIVKYLAEKGFTVVDAVTVAAIMQQDDRILQQATAGDPAAAARIGAANGADYIIIGTVTTSRTGGSISSQYNLQSGLAEIAVKVVNCSNGQVVAAKNDTATVAHSSMDKARLLAVEKAAARLMDQYLFEKIIASFQQTVNNGMEIDFTIHRVDDFTTQKEISNRLAAVADVISVNRRSFGSGIISFVITYRGSPDSFSEKVDGLIIAGKKIAVIEIAGNRVVGNLE